MFIECSLNGRYTTFHDLVVGGKGIYQPDPGNQHGNWWDAARKVIEHSVNIQ
jgi:hypothetical protein